MGQVRIAVEIRPVTSVSMSVTIIVRTIPGTSKHCSRHV